MKKAVYAAIVVGTLAPHYSDASWLTKIKNVFVASSTAEFSKINIKKVLNRIDDSILDTRAKVMKAINKKSLQEVRADSNIHDIEVPDGTINISVSSRKSGVPGPVRSYIYITTDSKIPELKSWMDDSLAGDLKANITKTNHIRRYEIDLSRQNKDRVRYTLNIFLQGIKKTNTSDVTIKSRKNI